jgi:hypothetical protein
MDEQGSVVMLKQRGLSLWGVILGLGLVGFVGVSAAKLLPAYTEYFSVKKIFNQMESSGSLPAMSVRDIRMEYEKRNAIEDVKSVRGDDLEITKAGGETVLSASWSAKVPMFGNLSACLDFYVTTGK